MKFFGSTVRCQCGNMYITDGSKFDCGHCKPFEFKLPKSECILCGEDMVHKAGYHAMLDNKLIVMHIDGSCNPEKFNEIKNKIESLPNFLKG